MLNEKQKTLKNDFEMVTMEQERITSPYYFEYRRPRIENAQKEN